MLYITGTNRQTDATGPLRSTPDVNRVLGEVRIRYRDLDDGVTFTTHQQLVAGGPLGAREGYSTLEAATHDLAQATAGDAAAAVVVQRWGRYFGFRLKGRDLETGLRAPAKPIYLERDERAEVIELRPERRIDRLAAIVDGEWSHRFRN